MTTFSPFGFTDRDTLAQIINSGGSATKAGREMIVQNIMQEYLQSEARSRTPTDEVAGALLRVIARTMVTFAVTLKVNGIRDESLPEITEDLMGFVEDALEIALLEFEAINGHYFSDPSNKAQ